MSRTREVWKPGELVRIRDDECVTDAERRTVWRVRGTLPEGGVLLVDDGQPSYEWVASPFDLVEAGPAVAQAQGGVV